MAEVGAALGFWSVDLWTFSEDADSLVCRAWWCRDGAAAGAGSCVGAVVGLDQSHDLRRLVLAAEVVERHAGDDLSPADAAALAQAGFTSRIDVPLLAGAEVLGVLSLAEKGPVRRLAAEDRERLGSLARLAAAVLRAARLYESEAERAGRLVALLAAGRGVAASLSVPDIVAAVRDEAAGMIPGVGLRGRGRPAPGRRDVRCPGCGATTRRSTRRPQMARADAIARQAVELGRAETARTPDGRARLVTPLLAAGQALGYIEFTAQVLRQFRPQEVELATLLAGQTAAALERARSLRALQSRSAVDTVSGLYSRWYFYERLYAEVARARRYREPLALVVAEVDREARLAASRGAAFRDAALAAVARLVLSSLRDKVDVACRLGAGRFALLLPNTPPGPSAAGLVAERIRVRVAGTHLSDDEVGELGRFTMSLGVAGYPDAAEDADELMAAAESRLAAALAAGGDRVEPPLPDPEEEDDEAPEGGRPDGTAGPAPPRPPARPGAGAAPARVSRSRAG